MHYTLNSFNLKFYIYFKNIKYNMALNCKQFVVGNFSATQAVSVTMLKALYVSFGICSFIGFPILISSIIVRF